jgi:hypothetical protein
MALIVSLLAMLVALSVTATAALAATPETPTAEPPTGVTATTATLHGLLNPSKAGAPGTFELATYEFVYRPSSQNECKGAGEVVTSTGMALGAGQEEVAQALEGLAAGTRYALCLITHNQANTASATSTPVSFTTTTPPQAPITGAVTEATGTTARFSGILNPSASAEPGLYAFFYEPSASECQGANSQSAAPGAVPSSGNRGEAVSVAVSGLSAHTTYTVCLIAFNGAFEDTEGSRQTFTTPAAAPTVSDESAGGVGASTATVNAEITPNGLPTGYHVEYVTEAQFQAHEWSGAARAPASDAEAPATSTPIRVSEELAGLQPGTPYRFRFVATSSLGVVSGMQATFSTVTATVGASTLPDGRVDELVSTSGNYGEPYEPTAPGYGVASHSERLFQAAFNGDGVAYVGEPAASGGNGNEGNGEGNEWLASRTSEGWKTSVISPSPTSGAGETSEPVYQWFSSDLSSGIVEDQAEPPLAPGVPAGCNALYARDNGSEGYTALLTSTRTPGKCGYPLFAGASEDQRQVIFQSERALTANAPLVTEVPARDPNGHAGGVGSEVGQTCSFGCNLYEAVAGQLRLVNVLPGPAATPVSSASFGGVDGESERLPDFSNAISSDGSRIYWTDTQTGPEMDHVYVLENGTDEVQVSGAEAAEYWTATPDGRYALYTEGHRLWQFDTSTGTRQELAGVGLNGEAPAVAGVVGTNETGPPMSYLYFVAENKLATNENANSETAVFEQPNLYLRHGGVTTFIATLAPRDNQLVNSTLRSEGGDWTPDVGMRTAQVTGDGQRLVFQSLQRLTGYDNVDAANGNLISEVFRYDAGDTQISCVSCDPSGIPPQIHQEENQSQLPSEGLGRTIMRRWVSEDGGRVFFDSRQSLVPQDENGVQDVYEWEAEGEGTCLAQVVPRLNRGCVSLLSGGDSKDLSFLVDADAKGENVFFEHRGALGEADVAPDKNQLYDARVDGGFPGSSLACTGAGCQGAPPAPPIFATPASATFMGAGNFPPATPAKVLAKSLTRAQKLAVALKACGKEKNKRKRVSCQTRARKRYGAKSKTIERKVGKKRRVKS